MQTTEIGYYNEDLQMYCYTNKTTWESWKKQDEAILKRVNTLLKAIRLKTAIGVLILAGGRSVDASTLTKKSINASPKQPIIQGNLNNESRTYKVYKEGQELVHDENGNLVKKASLKKVSLIQKCIAEENKKARQEALLMKLIIQCVVENSGKNISKNFLLKSSVKRELAFSDKFFDRIANKKLNKQAEQTVEKHIPQIDAFTQKQLRKRVLNKTFLKTLALRGGELSIGLGSSGWLAKKGLEYIKTKLKKESTDLLDPINLKSIFSNPQKEENERFIHHLKTLRQFNPSTIALAIAALLTTQTRDIIAENTVKKKQTVLQILKSMINFHGPYPYILIGTCIIFYNRGVFYQIFKGEIKPMRVLSEVIYIIIKQLQNTFREFATLITKQSDSSSHSFKDDLIKDLYLYKKHLPTNKERPYIFKKTDEGPQFINLPENNFYLSKEAQKKIKDYEIKRNLARPFLDPKFPSNTVDMRFPSEDNND